MSLTFVGLLSSLTMLLANIGNAGEPAATVDKRALQTKAESQCPVHSVPLIEETRFFPDDDVCIDYAPDFVSYFVVALVSRKMPHFLLYDATEKKTQLYTIPKTVSYCTRCESDFQAGYERFKELPDKEKDRLLAAARKAMQDYSAEQKQDVEQAGAGEAATRSESDSEDGEKPQPESDGRSR